VNCLKNNVNINIKTTPTCFGAVTPSSGSALFVLAKVTVPIKIHRCVVMWLQPHHHTTMYFNWNCNFGKNE